jgi:hypothetical protein
VIVNGRPLIVVAWAIGGLLFAVALTGGAFALAGREIATPAGPMLTSPAASSEPRDEKPSAKAADDRSDHRHDDRPTVSPSDGSESQTTNAIASEGSSTASAGSTDWTASPGTGGGEMSGRSSDDPTGSGHAGSDD